MSWSDFRARSALLNEVLGHAAHDLPAAWEVARSDRAQLLFGGPDGVLLALQQRWTTHLAALLDAALEAGTTGPSAHAELARRQPALRAILDAGAEWSPLLRAGQRSEQQMINEHTNFQFHSMTAGLTSGAAPLRAQASDEAIAS